MSLETTPCSPDNAGTTSSAPVPEVVLIGSSSAAGSGASTFEHAYAGRLSSWLSANAPTSCLQDLAASGYTTYELRPASLGYTPQRPGVDSARNIDAALALAPRLLIIHLPSNDVAYGYTLSESLKNLEAMIDQARAADVDVAVVGPHPRGLSGDRRDSLIRWARILDTISRVETIQVWDSLSTDSTALRAGVRQDGVHFNDSGHAIVFRQILRSRSWESLFGKPSASTS